MSTWTDDLWALVGSGGPWWANKTPALDEVNELKNPGSPSQGLQEDFIREARRQRVTSRQRVGTPALFQLVLLILGAGSLHDGLAPLVLYFHDMMVKNIMLDDS